MAKYLSVLFSIIILSTCGQEPGSTCEKENEYHIIPLPHSLTELPGQFNIDDKTTIISSGLEGDFKRTIEDFKQTIQNLTGYNLTSGDDATQSNAIVFQLDEQIESEEGYSLKISLEQVNVSAKSHSGLFYAIQTIKQLLPSSLDNEHSPCLSTLPCAAIEDSPRFPYRGMHFDVSRHFFDINTVKQLIDQLAYHKLNYFHWHLTDDQGWRIEIKQYPKLTEIGGFRNGTLVGHYNDQPHQFDGQRYGGFYTQEEIKEVVQYATDRFITVVPEIEMPGHAQAALAAYPELGCEGEQFEVWQKWGVSDNVFCPTEETFAFLEDVIDEVIALFPSPYIHIGGDESPKTKWEESAFCQQLIRQENLKDEHELQSYFIKRMEAYINSKGRQIIGWDEILEGGLAPNATVMSWRGIEGGIEAAKAGHDVVMTPTSHCYFDYYQSDHPDEPLAIGGLIPLEKIYNYEPIPAELSDDEAKHVLGTQANIWTEYIQTVEKLEYMIFPRLSALSEVAWSAKADRDFNNFVPRLSTHIIRLDEMGIQAANHLYDLNSSIQPKGGKVLATLSTLAQNTNIYYTLDGSDPSVNSTLYDSPIAIETDGILKVQSFVRGGPQGRAWTQAFNIHKAAGKQITLSAQPHPKYLGGGNGSIINGVNGSNERYGDAEWLGFDGENMEAIIDLGQKETLTEAVFRFFKGEGQWIYLPKSVTISISDDGKTFTEITKDEDITGDSKVVEHPVSLEGTSSRYLKIKVQNFGIIPKGQQGGGNKAWLFVDEILVK